MAAHASDAQTLVEYLRQLANEDAGRAAHATLTPQDYERSHYEHLLAAHMASKVDLDERWAAQALRCGFENTPDRWLTARINEYDREEAELIKLHDKLRAAGILKRHDDRLQSLALAGRRDCTTDEQAHQERDTNNGSSFRPTNDGNPQLLARDAVPGRVRL